MAYAVVVGIDGQASSIAGHLSSAKDTIGGWLQDLGLDSGKADSAKVSGRKVTLVGTSACAASVRVTISRVGSARGSGPW